MSEYIPLWWW